MDVSANSQFSSPFLLSMLCSLMEILSYACGKKKTKRFQISHLYGSFSNDSEGVKHGHCMVGVPLHATLCICPQISRETSSVQTLQKVLSIKLTEVPLWLWVHACKKITYSCYKLCSPCQKCSRLWKPKNNPACTKNM